MVNNDLYEPFAGPDQGSLPSPGQGDDYGGRHGSGSYRDDFQGELEVNPLYAPWEAPAQQDKPRLPPPTAPKPAAPGKLDLSKYPVRTEALMRPMGSVNRPNDLPVRHQRRPLHPQPPYQPSFASPESEEGAGYASPADAIPFDQARRFVGSNLGGPGATVPQGIYAQPHDHLPRGTFQKVKPSVPTTPRPTLPSTNSSIASESGQDTFYSMNMSRQSNQSGIGGQLQGNQSKLKSQRDIFIEALEKLKDQYSLDSSSIDQESGTIEKSGKIKKDKKKVPKQKHKKKGTMAPPKKPAKQLEQLILNENGIPPFIEQCVQRLEEEGIAQEGIYRVSGKAADIDLIIKMFDENENASLSAMENLSANTIAAALKQFFKSLPEPIIPYSTQDRMIQDYRELNCEEAFVERLPEYLSGLGSVRRTVLTYMMKHMRRITDHSDVNLMTAENLSICWWPSMLHPQSTSFEDLANEQLLAVVFKQIVENAPQLFNFTVTEYSEKNKMEAKNMAICWCPTIFTLPMEDFHTKLTILTQILIKFIENAETLTP
ncbi:uncharacterized protein [Diadema setosum]|uniref:uncharacterized protein n=1 Tax=Diadema setosum TaxID=31175 RepID=UPI003B3A8B3C